VQVSGIYATPLFSSPQPTLTFLLQRKCLFRKLALYTYFRSVAAIVKACFISLLFSVLVFSTFSPRNCD